MSHLGQLYQCYENFSMTANYRMRNRVFSRDMEKASIFAAYLRAVDLYG